MEKESPPSAANSPTASGNPAAARLSNLDIGQHIGQTFDEIWPSARETGLTDRYLQVMRTGQTFQTEELFYEDGRLTGIFSIRAFRIPEDRLCIAFENVTEGRRAERALHESQRKLSTLMANLPGMAYRCLVDEQWTMEFASEGCFELTGYKSEDVIGNLVRLTHVQNHGSAFSLFEGGRYFFIGFSIVSILLILGLTRNPRYRRPPF